MSSQLGLIGLGTMGSALARNLASRGFRVSLWNRTREKALHFVESQGAESFYAAENIEDFVESLEKPRLIMVMLPAGPATEEMLGLLKNTLQAGDSVLEGGNAFYKDTERWVHEFEALGIYFLGTGVSGGEEGALRGPSLMPGGSKEAYEEFAHILKTIAAEDFEGKACTAYMGSGGAGHYVKMVHNGIEYAEMQVLAEAYDLLKNLFELRQEEILEIFTQWQKGQLDSFLLDAACEVLRKKEGEHFLLEFIKDTALQKGTGQWTSEEALRLGIPTPSFSGAVFARAFSSQKEKRSILAEHYPVHREAPKILVPEYVEHLEKALVASRIAHFEQGFALLEGADKEYKFGLNILEIARVWQGGCIIRCRLLKNFIGVLSHSSSLYSGLWTEQNLKESYESWKQIVSTGILHEVPVLGFSSALAHFESSRAAESPANFIQALRDRFGSHGYERTDQEGIFHSEWP